MSRRIRVNLTRWVCYWFGHKPNLLLQFTPEGWRPFECCDRCGRVW